MLLKVNHHAQEPLYLQIRAQIVAAIASGDLRSGDNLPSVRSLAADLGVNLHTVNKAYAVLRDEGYLVMQGRSGARIADYQQQATALQSKADEERMASSLYLLALEHRARGGSPESFVRTASQQAQRAFADAAPSGPQGSPSLESENLQPSDRADGSSSDTPSHAQRTATEQES